MKSIYILGLYLISTLCLAQGSITGKVIDTNSNLPLSGATVYFENSTIGVITDKNGRFNLEFTTKINEPLIISYMGYENYVLYQPNEQSDYLIKLKPKVDALEEVFITNKELMTRKQKLKFFKAEFLGNSKSAKSCQLKGEENLILKYNEGTKTLNVTSKGPIYIENKYLGYSVIYNLKNFELNFSLADIENQHFHIYKVFFQGSAYYKDLDTTKNKRISKKRKKVYLGSSQHFMRSIYKDSLKENDFKIAYKGFVRESNQFIRVIKISQQFKRVFIKENISILYNKSQTDLKLETNSFMVDQFGTYMPTNAVYFNGEMGKKRFADMLPTNYTLN